MDHRPYERMGSDGDTAVLMLHGIMGTPRHFDMLLPLIPEEWSVYNILLPGHGGTTLDFGRSSMAAWRDHAMKTFRKLCGKYDRVVLVGHSMGTLFAIRMARERPDKVPFLFLLASPMALGLKPIMVENALRVGFNRVREDVPWQCATREACSVGTTMRLWEYLSWVPRYLELFREIGEVRKLISGLAVPCFAIQSGKDEMVSHRAVKILEASGSVRVTVLPHAGHYYYPEEDRERILTAFREHCNTIMKKTR